MAIQKAEFYFDAVRRYRAQAQEASRAGHSRVAATYLLEAARNLLLLAHRTSGELRDIQVQKARELRQLAERMANESSRKGTKRKAPEPEGDGESADASPWMLPDRPNVSFDDIVGLDDLKGRIRRFVAKFQNPEETAKWTGARLGDRIILFGPPGTGKTMFAKAVAHEIDAMFFLVKGSNIMDKWVGASQKNVQRLFDAVRRSTPAVVFLDEIDGILARRGSNSSVRDSVVSEFIQEMEGLSTPNSAVLFVAATNLPSSLDKAVISRFGAMYYVPLPDKAARLELLQREFARFPYGYSSDVALDQLAERLQGHSMRAISTLAAVLNDIGIQESLDGAHHVITGDNIGMALRELPRPLSPAELAAYEKLSGCN